jgi:Arylsulfotransferase (ASST)
MTRSKFSGAMCVLSCMALTGCGPSKGQPEKQRPDAGAQPDAGASVLPESGAPSASFRAEDASSPAASSQRPALPDASERDVGAGDQDAESSDGSVSNGAQDAQLADVSVLDSGPGSDGAPASDGEAGIEPDAGLPNEAGPGPKDAAPEPDVVLALPPDAGACDFAIDAELSSSIGTVGIVRWISALPDIEKATIEFGLKGQARRMEAPVSVEDLGKPEVRTLLLGMKGNREYTFTIIVSAGEKTCVSSEQTLRTGQVPTIGVPQLNHVRYTEGASEGFIISSAGMSRDVTQAYIFDTDGDIVWWSPAPVAASRARMDWSGKNMWTMALNVNGGVGRMTRVSMDGLDRDSSVDGLSAGHHDFTVLPDGKLAIIVHETAQNASGCSGVIEYDPATETTVRIVDSVDSLYVPGAGAGGVAQCHPNSILYHPADDTFTLSDRNPNLYVKFTHQGQLVWQLGGKNPKDGAKMFAGTGLDWTVNHGHHLLADGRIVFFNNEAVGASHILEFGLNETTLTATKLWDVSDGATYSRVLGDVQRLPNGNTLLVYSVPGIMREISPSGQVVQDFWTADEGFGYADFRESLYGAAPR